MTTAVTTQAAELPITRARTQLQRAAVHAHLTFAEHKDELADLRPSFWSSLADFRYAFDEPDPDAELEEAFKLGYKRWGAPGDFGYGTPCGEALRQLYNAWNIYAEARNDRESSAA